MEINDNNYTAEFWQYDSKLGRRWNLDPRPSADLSSYSVLTNDPILHNDILGDTPRIYGNAEATRSTLSHKGGTADQAGNAIVFNDARLVPAVNPSNNLLVGYNVFDTKNTGRDMPVMQLEPNDVEDFKTNYKSYMLGARVYYANGEPTEGQKKYAAAFEKTINTGKIDLNAYADAIKQQWQEALSDKAYVASLIMAFAHAGIEVHSGINIPEG